MGWAIYGLMIIFLLKSHKCNHPTQWVGVKHGLWTLTMDLILDLSLNTILGSISILDINLRVFNYKLVHFNTIRVQ